MKTREDLKKELKALSKDELIEAIMISPMVTGFILKKCKPKNEQKKYFEITCGFQSVRFVKTCDDSTSDNARKLT